MSCCSDVMKPIEASSCCTPEETAAHAARAIPSDRHIQPKTSVKNASR